MVLLQMSDHRLDSGPLRRKLPEPGRVFQRSLMSCLSWEWRPSGNGRGPEGPSRPGLRIPDPPSASSEALRWPFPIRPRAAWSVVESCRLSGYSSCVTTMPRSSTARGDLNPVLVGFARLVLRDAGDLRLMGAVNSRRSRDLPGVILRLGYDPFQNPRFRPESFPDSDQDGGHRLQHIPAQTLSDLPGEAGGCALPSPPFEPGPSCLGRTSPPTEPPSGLPGQRSEGSWEQPLPALSPSAPAGSPASGTSGGVRCRSGRRCSSPSPWCRPS